jgi:uncharacterized membrane protein YraQ (UPF0718 family)
MRAGYLYLLIAVMLLGLSFLKDKQKTREAVKATFKIFYVVLPVLVFVLMGLIQAYVSREFIVSILGQKSGLLGIFYAEIIGSIALFLPPAVFPFGGYLHDNGASYGAIAGFVFTAILIGVTTLPLELKLFGKRFTLARNLLTFGLTFFIAILMEGILP